MVQALQRLRYRAAVCPVKHDAGSTMIRAYREAAASHDILIAEVGAWSNPISPDDDIRRTAVQHCTEQLALADEIGARVCVNIAGSRGEQWDGPHPENLSQDTFALIVDTVRDIIDSVKPSQTYYALESMPWVWPDSPEAYVDLVRAINRPRFAVHLDPVNLINTPRRFYENGAFIQHCFQLLGPWIQSVHAKDIRLGGRLTVHLDEAIPGTGALDYDALLRALAGLPDDTPMLVEHLETEAEYEQATDFIRDRASALGIKLE